MLGEFQVISPAWVGYEKSDDLRLVKRVISLRGKVYFWHGF